MSRRIFTAVAMLGAVLSCLAANAEAASLPALADVRVGGRVDAGSFRRSVASRYQVEFNRVLTADIDRDGDIDVVATTDRTFTVWVNDGTGHLTSHRPSRDTNLDARPSRTAWRGHEERDDPSSNDGSVPSSPILVEQAHGPPSLSSAAAVTRDAFVRAVEHSRFSAPRAPPAL